MIGRVGSAEWLGGGEGVIYPPSLLFFCPCWSGIYEQSRDRRGGLNVDKLQYYNLV